MSEVEAIERITLTNQGIAAVVNDFKFLIETRVTYTNTQLVKYIDLLYKRACYNYIFAIFHHSPQFLAALVAIWGVIVAIYNGIRWVIDFFHIKEMLQLINILSILWPEFRMKMNQIYGKISEFSSQIGWGADGLSHLIQAAQGGINLMGGFLGKPESWLRIHGADRVVKAMERLSAWSSMIKNDPGQLLDLVFRSQSNITMREHKKWWNDTMAWLDKTANIATEAIQKVNDTIDNLLELHNNLPQIIKNHIPQSLFDGLTWVDNQIDDTILPALTSISREFTIINSELQAQRRKASNLAAMLTAPGDLLLGIDDLTGENKMDQQIKIDDVTSRFYELQTDKIYDEDSDVIEGLASIRKIASMDLPVPVFMNIETIGRPGIVWDKAEEVDGWFVGDF